MQKHYVNESGAYVGSYDGPDESNPYLPDAVMVETPPPDGRQVWNAQAGIWMLPLTAIKDDAARAIQGLLDSAAIARRYDSGVSFASYVVSTNPAWVAEAEAFVAWRDAVWAYAYGQFDLIEAGQRQMPENIEAFLAELPAPSWPA